MSSIYIPESSNWEAEKAKILKEAKVKAWEGIPKVASFAMKDQDPYPSPYLNLSDYQIPRNMVEVFKWCRYFYKFDSLIGGAVNALARFPVTDIILEDMEALPEGWDQRKDSPTLELYRQVFEDLRIYEELVKIGIDYWLYGNCFVFGEFNNFSEDPATPDIRWKHIFRLDPSKVVIDIDPLTQEKTFKWEVPPKIKRVIRERKPKEKYDSIPDKIKKAVRENKMVVLNSLNTYHFSREGESGDGSVWGTPIILNVMKQLAYRNLLRQAQEAIAREHIVPFRVYYLEPNERMDPLANWSNVASEFSKQLEQSAKDPNYKLVSPVPVNVLNLGGQGRALMLTPEIEQLQGEILAGMGVPREFIFGGVSYSAASISLRTLENQFINYRLLLIDFMNNFIIKRMAQVRGEWRHPVDNPYLVTAKLADLKMQDDVQQKQLVINLNAANKVADEYMYNMLGMDPDKMKAQIEIEIFERMDRERRMQLYNLETQYYMQQTQMQYDMSMQQQLGAAMMPMPVEGAEGVQETQQGNQRQQRKQERQNKQKEVPIREGSRAQSNKKQENNKAKEIEKKSSHLTPVLELQLNTVVHHLSKLGEDARKEVLSKVSSSLRDTILERMDKVGASNPYTVGNSSNRVIRLGNMTEIEKLDALKREGPAMAMQSSTYNTENAIMPNPTKNPPRRQTLV